MNYKTFIIALATMIFIGCGHGHQHEDEHPSAPSADGHNHDDMGELPKHQFTAYSQDFELFAEADAFIAGNPSNVLAHFTKIEDFKALSHGHVSIRLIVNGKETKQTLTEATRNGIYSFDIIPEVEGKAKLVFEIDTDDGHYQLELADIRVYDCAHEAMEEADHEEISMINVTAFTKEQSWKIDFETQLPQVGPFGQIIKTTAQIRSAPEDETLISAKTNGIVLLAAKDVLEGKSVSAGQVLFNISGSGLADNNSAVRFIEAKNNFEKAHSDYERLKTLASDHIVSQKELLKAKNEYDNAKIIYDNLNENFDANGQIVTSPLNGYIKHLFVQEGEYIEAGQAIVSVSQNKKLLLHADVQQKYASILNSIYSANIRTVYDNKTYTLEQLNGRLVSYGRSTSQHNYQIPIHFQIDNLEDFVSGGFVELFIKTNTNKEALSVPNEALLEAQGNYFVFTQLNPELFEKREVKTGTTDGLRTEILSGIKPDERIVTKGAILVSLAQSTGTLDAHSGHVH